VTVGYYFTDWLGMGLNLLGIYFIGGENKKLGWMLGAAGCVFWILFGILVHSIPVTLFEVAMLGFYLRGYIKRK